MPVNKWCQSTLIVFAKEPRLGQVKTRLQKNLPKNVVLKLYEAFLKDVMSVSAKVNSGGKYIYYTGARTFSCLGRYKRKFSYRQQRGKTLGIRLQNAFQYAEKKGMRRIVVIGTDCVTMTPRLIQKSLFFA